MAQEKVAGHLGRYVDRLTQRWVRLTGRNVPLRECPWLDGPVGKETGIGDRFFDQFASERGLRLKRGEQAGLLTSFDDLRSATFDPEAVSPHVRQFYCRTSDYELDAWSEWCGGFRPFGWALAVIFSRRLQQLNVPLSNLDTSRGMTSEVVSVVDAEAGRAVWTIWVRRLVGPGHVVYAGAYSTCTVPDGQTRCVKVVFPLPNGNAMVLMRPRNHPDGSLELVSAGRGFGGPGFYFTVHTADSTVSARFLRSLRESIRVYESDGAVRADHVLTLWGLTFLRLHYRLRLRVV
jgi:hypothetical protein